MNDNTMQLADVLNKCGETLGVALQAQAGEPTSFSEMEQRVREVLVSVGRTTLDTWVKQLDTQTRPPKIVNEDAEEAKYEGQREGTMYTVFGKLKVKRAYYLYTQRSGGLYPLDERLGWRPNAMSAELERLSGLVGVQVPFGKGSDLFEALTLVSISDQSVDKATQAYGYEVARREAEWQAEAADHKALLRGQRETHAPLRLYGTMDGVTVHIRRETTDEPTETEGKNGKDPWRELKMGAWFTTESRPPRSPDEEWTIHAKAITYYADICAAKQFGELFWATGVQCHAHRARELIILGDGAQWIWRLVDEHFPHAVQIVDWFHACEYLSPVAKVAFKDSKLRDAWVAQVRTDLWEGRIEAVIEACTPHITPSREDDPAQATVTYFTNNRARMDYPTYRDNGYQIGSGTIESAAKQIGLLRLKVPGARWDLDSARLVAKARAAFLSNDWDTLAARRSNLGRSA